MVGIEPGMVVSLAGLAGGLVLGLAARVGRFCFMGAVEDAVYGGATERLRMVALAAAVAVGGTALVAALGLMDPADTVYMRIGTPVGAALLGGLMFGFGMAQVGTCAFGSLARAGGGDLRSAVLAAVIGIAGAATLVGPLAPLRLALIGQDGGGGADLAAATGEALGTGRLLPALAVALALAALARPAAMERRSAGWAGAVGLLVPAAWVATGWASEASFHAVRLESFSFVAPLGQGLMQAMTGEPGLAPGFGVGAVAGVVVGAALGARLRGEVRWEACDDARELRRQLLGAVLMGVGGVLALGCTVGQGLSALSVLSATAPLTLAAIFAGARLGLYVLVEGTA